MRNLGRFQGWRGGEKVPSGCPRAWALRPVKSPAVLSNGEYREGSWSCQQRRRLVVGGGSWRKF